MSLRHPSHSRRREGGGNRVACETNKCLMLMSRFYTRKIWHLQELVIERGCDNTGCVYKKGSLHVSKVKQIS